MGIYSDILLTSDFDHTLTGPDAKIPEKNIEAIRHFIANGGAFTVNTGRSLPMARYFLEDVPVSAPVILYNGGATYDLNTGKFTKIYPIQLDPKETVEKLLRMFPDLVLEIQGTDAHYSFRKAPGWEGLLSSCGCAFQYTDMDHVPLPLINLSLCWDCPEGNISAYFTGSEAENQRMENAIAQIQQEFEGKLDVCHPCIKIVDIQAPGVSKLQAARDLQAQLGRKILIGVGDANNDLPLLEGADFSFCPADASVADCFPNVCKCGDGAVADVIYNKIPEILSNNA